MSALDLLSTKTSDRAGRPARGQLPFAAVVLVTAAAYAAFSQGAFYVHQFRLLLVIVALAFAASVAARPLHRAEVRSAPVLACGFFAAASLVSGVAAGDPWGAAPVMGLLAALGAVVVVVRRLTGAQRELVALGLITIGVVVALSGWAGVAWRQRPYALPGQGLWRAASTVTYANAAAGLLVPLALLALGRLAAGARGKVAVLSPYLLLVGVAATLSRGGLVALGTGLVVLVAVTGVRRTVPLLAPVIGSVVALALLVPSFPAGLPARPMVALAGLVLGGLVSVACLRPNGWRVGAGLVAVGLVATLALGGVDRVRTATSAVAGARLTTASHDRLEGTAATLRLAASRPVLGVGPGQFVLRYRSHDGRALRGRYTHNEYLQVLAEQGAAGVAVLAGGLGATFLALLRARPRHSWLWPAAVAGLAALALHSGVDFLWHVPVIPLVGAMILALALPPPPAPSPVLSSPTKEEP